ncbi:MAG TPA: EamA family transporter [Candidatus Paceibacterota bacterium]
MNSLIPLFAAILQAGSFVTDKITLNIRGVSFKTYVGVSFPLIFLITFIIFLIFRPPLTADLFVGNLGLFFIISIGTVITSNILYYRALKHDGLGEMEVLSLLVGVPVIIFSSAVFSDERKLYVVIPALLAALAIIWSHWEGRHIHLARRTWPFFLFAFFSAPFRSGMQKLLLVAWNPISLELMQSAAVAVVLGILFWQQVRSINLKTFYLLVLTNVLTSVAWILVSFSIQRSGIIYTGLLFSINPLLVYFSSVLFLGEKTNWKKNTAFAVVLLSIATVQVLS